MSLEIPRILNCQVDGLLKVYTYDKNVYFAFAKKQQLQLAKKKINFACNQTNNRILSPNILLFFSSFPKNTNFSFGVSAKLENTIGTPISSSEELIKRIADVIATVSIKKEVPIVPIECKDLDFQKLENLPTKK